jgi:RNA polymerase sigma-70 factor, ECF subfamily
VERASARRKDGTVKHQPIGEPYASRHRSKRRSVMPSKVLEIDEAEATNASSDLGTEEAVVNAAKRGNGQAFEILVKCHKAKILALALRYTRAREDAEDVVQQSFQKAFVHLHKFEGKSSFSTWLTRIAINEALIWLRKVRSLREVPMDASNSDEAARAGLEIADARPDPEACYLEREGARMLFEAMRKLRPGTRATIELRDVGELSARETARRMGLSISAVKARVFHGRRKLREILRPYMRSPRMSLGGISALTGNASGISLDRLAWNARAQGQSDRRPAWPHFCGGKQTSCKGAKGTAELSFGRAYRFTSACSPPLS